MHVLAAGCIEQRVEASGACPRYLRHASLSHCARYDPPWQMSASGAARVTLETANPNSGVRGTARTMSLSGLLPENWGSRRAGTVPAQGETVGTAQ